MESILAILVLLILMAVLFLVAGGIYYRLFFGELYPTFKSAVIRGIEDIVDYYEQGFKRD